VAEQVPEDDLGREMLPFGEVTTTFAQFAKTINFGDPSAVALERQLSLTKPDRSTYAFDVKLITLLDSVTTSASDLDFLGPHADFAKEQFLMDFLNEYSLKVHQRYLEKQCFLPFNYTIAALCVYQLHITQGKIVRFMDFAARDRMEYAVIKNYTGSTHLRFCVDCSRCQGGSTDSHRLIQQVVGELAYSISKPFGGN
jgi:hypothetical protein